MKTLIFSLALVSSASAFAHPLDGSHMDRALNQAELRTLLPQYVHFIEADGSKAPTPVDNDAYRSLTSLINSPTKFVFAKGKGEIPKVIGQETYSNQEILASVEDALNEAKRITPDDRVKSVNDMLDGFRAGGAHGRLSCRLGYTTVKGDAEDRIVTCTDDHSVTHAPDSEDEFADIRTFSLSVNAKTLRPVGILSLEYLRAD